MLGWQSAVAFMQAAPGSARAGLFSLTSPAYFEPCSMDQVGLHSCEYDTSN